MLSVEQHPEGLHGVHMTNKGILCVPDWLPQNLEDFGFQINPYHPGFSDECLEMFVQMLPATLKRFWLNRAEHHLITPSGLKTVASYLASKQICFEVVST